MLNGIEKREQEATGSKEKEDAKRITRALREKKGIVSAPKEDISKIIEREIRMKKKRDKIERRGGALARRPTTATSSRARTWRSTSRRRCARRRSRRRRRRRRITGTRARRPRGARPRKRPRRSGRGGRRGGRGREDRRAHRIEAEEAARARVAQVVEGEAPGLEPRAQGRVEGHAQEGRRPLQRQGHPARVGGGEGGGHRPRPHEPADAETQGQVRRDRRRLVRLDRRRGAPRRASSAQTPRARPFLSRAGALARRARAVLRDPPPPPHPLLPLRSARSAGRSRTRSSR